MPSVHRIYMDQMSAILVRGRSTVDTQILKLRANAQCHLDPQIGVQADELSAYSRTDGARSCVATRHVMSNSCCLLPESQNDPNLYV